MGVRTIVPVGIKAKELQKLGHTVELMAPQFAKSYAKSHKNDANDTEATCEAAARPNMRFVAIKYGTKHIRRPDYAQPEAVWRQFVR